MGSNDTFARRNIKRPCQQALSFEWKVKKIIDV